MGVVIKMLKFAICDDEPLMARDIADRLSSYMEEKRMTSYCVSSFSSVKAHMRFDGPLSRPLIVFHIQ